MGDLGQAIRRWLDERFGLESLLQFTKKKTVLTLNEFNAANALHIVAVPKISGECGNPDYEVEMEITRQQTPALNIDDKGSPPVTGTPSP